MGQKTVRFSDLSGQLITDDEAPARIVVCTRALTSGAMSPSRLVQHAPHTLVPWVPAAVPRAAGIPGA